MRWHIAGLLMPEMSSKVPLLIVLTELINCKGLGCVFMMQVSLAPTAPAVVRCGHCTIAKEKTREGEARRRCGRAIT